MIMMIGIEKVACDDEKGDYACKCVLVLVLVRVWTNHIIENCVLSTLARSIRGCVYVCMD